MRGLVVLVNSLAHHVEQFIRVVNDPGMFKRLARMKPSDCKWCGDSDYVRYLTATPALHAVLLVLKHMDFFGGIN